MGCGEPISLSHKGIPDVALGDRQLYSNAREKKTLTFRATQINGGSYNMVVIGVNSAYHESSAALLVDGVLLAAAEEERFNRIKHGKHSAVDNADDLPWQIGRAHV